MPIKADVQQSKKALKFQVVQPKSANTEHTKQNINVAEDER